MKRKNIRIAILIFCLSLTSSTTLLSNSNHHHLIDDEAIKAIRNDKVNDTSLLDTNSNISLTPVKKRAFNVHLSIPVFNAFHFKPNKDGYVSKTSFGGFSLGIDYYTTENFFANISFSTLRSSPTSVGLNTRSEFVKSSYFAASNNHKIKRVTLGYGISYSINIHQITNHEGNEYYSSFVRKRNNYVSFGFVFPAYYRLGRNLNLGVIYRPSFNPNYKINFDYEHLISFDIAYKIRL